MRFKDEEPDGRSLPSAGKAESHIRELAERLEVLRNRNAQASLQAAARSFRWEADPEGLIFWVEGAPRGPLVGQSIASPAAPGAFGVDGQAVGAFKRRAPFRDARFSVAGEGAASGDWRISGVPIFDPGRGHFLGYRGSARRPRLDETAAPSAASDGLFGTQLPPDALRQLIHELRTPLNAIVGFAEMIEGEYLGPAAEGYRARANAIREEAGRLLAAADDLDTAAQIETRRFPVEESATDLAVLLSRLHADFERAAEHRGAALRIDFAPHLPPARIEPASAERMVSRLLAATLGLAEEGEPLRARMRIDPQDSSRLCLAIARPRSIAGRSEDELLDPGYSPEGDWPKAPALGLGFALRLVRNLAEMVGGSLAIEAEDFLLRLPALAAAEKRSGGKS